ncbi:MAG: E3 ubiquitin protein ligase [Bacteroidetes bacterium]|nr:E3 ubiquitin protein ligase [Bacteroidota bacterium]
MDYVLDFYLGPSPANQEGTGASRLMHTSFTYDDYRVFSKIYLTIKSFGVVFYVGTLTRCANPLIYIIMNGLMFLSAANTARYEYRHCQRYGTVFISIPEYEEWKAGLWPKSRFVFSAAELALKIGYFIYTFPPVFHISSICEVGKSVFMIHVLAILFVYFVSFVFTCCMYCCVCYPNGVGTGAVNRVGAGAAGANVPIRMVSLVLPTTFVSHNKECCICLDDTAESHSQQQWLGLPCGHIFHHACISRWLLTNETCPVCRLNIRVGVT